MSEPVFSALVCTYNRARLLERTLESLVAQTRSAPGFEVVVVDDGSTDDTRELVASFTGRIDLRYAYQRNSGVASARNHALFLARGHLVLFQDDDDVVEPGLLAAHAYMHAKHPEPQVAVLGFTGLSPELRADPLMHYVTEVGCQLFCYPFLTHGDSLDYRFFWNGRISCKRPFLLSSGVFNPAFRYMEDIELGYRLRRFGLRVVYSRDAASTMVRGLTLDEFCQRAHRHGRYNGMFYGVHRDEEVRSYIGLDAHQPLWSAPREEYGRRIDRARRADTLARRKIAAGLPLADDVEILHAAYADAILASRIRGTREVLDASVKEEGPCLGPGP